MISSYVSVSMLVSVSACFTKLRKFSLVLGMSDFEVLCYDNYSLKYHHYCKYHNVHLVGYNSAVKLKSQVYGKFTPHVTIYTGTKISHVSTQTEICFIAPAYNYTKQLCMVNWPWSAFPECFLSTK